MGSSNHANDVPATYVEPRGVLFGLLERLDHLIAYALSCASGLARPRVSENTPPGAWQIVYDSGVAGHGGKLQLRHGEKVRRVKSVAKPRN